MVAVASPAAKTRVKASPPPVTKAAENSAIAQITHRLTGTTGAMIDAIWAVREEKRELEAQVKELNAKLADYELQLDVKMAKEGVDKATGKSASASFSTSVSATVIGEDGWDLAFPWIAKNKLWHLLRRQLNDTAYRELLEAGKKVPGMQPFTKKRLNLRTLSS